MDDATELKIDFVHRVALLEDRIDREKRLAKHLNDKLYKTTLAEADGEKVLRKTYRRIRREHRVLLRKIAERQVQLHRMLEGDPPETMFS